MLESDLPAIARTIKTATMAKRKAAIWTGNVFPRKTRERAAPKAAPEEIPRMNSLTRGFRNTAWRDAPETEREAPTARARRRRGSLILNTISL